MAAQDRVGEQVVWSPPLIEVTVLVALVYVAIWVRRFWPGDRLAARVALGG